jgi:hypothetical protein
MMLTEFEGCYNLPGYHDTDEQLVRIEQLHSIRKVYLRCIIDVINTDYRY